MHQETRNSVDISTIKSSEFFDELELQLIDNDEQAVATGTNLQNINDDCLLEIFSMKSLALMDLWSLSETCKRFQEIIGRASSALICTINFEGEYQVLLSSYLCSRKKKCKEVHEELNAQDIERIFKNFGSILTEVTISTKIISTNFYDYPIIERTVESNFVLTLVTEYCDCNLKGLTIRGSEISQVLEAKLKPIFKRLSLLCLKDVFITDHRTLFANCDLMVELRIEEYENFIIAVLENHFPKLERFTYCGISTVKFSNFISRHDGLKKCNISTNSNMYPILIPLAISNTCKKLEELSLWQGSHTNTLHYQPLRTLKSLRVLHLHSVSFENFKFIAPMTNLRELCLKWCDFPKESNPFTCLVQLTILKMEYCDLVDADVVGIIRRLINLEELTMKNASWIARYKLVLDLETFSQIVDLVEERSQGLTLTCEFNFHLPNWDANQKVRLIRTNCS